jgi:hydroxysqualene dehydroxylase
MRTDFDCVIVGGGLAGIAAAVARADSGQRVALIEARRRLGGRATSFVDQTTGAPLDNCQHVTLGCCTHYLRLCERLGVADCFAWDDRQWWIERGGTTSLLKPGILPAPLHYAGAFLNASFLSATEKLAIANAMRELMVVDGPAHAASTFGEYLATLDQPRGAIAKFWAPVIVSACNLPVHRVSAAPAIKVFQDGFLPSKSAGRIGLPTLPLADLYNNVPSILSQRGGRIFMGEHAGGITPTHVTTVSGTTYAAPTIICALPIEKAITLVRDHAGSPDPRLANVHEVLHFSPILGVHIETDLPILTTPHAVLVDCPTQWLFRKSGDGRRFHAVISAADDWMEDTQERIVERVMSDVRACIPAARNARVTWARAVKERRATFAATPRFEAWRQSLPSPRDLAAPSVHLVGDYTNTGWPATMEGAVRSALL